MKKVIFTLIFSGLISSGLLGQTINIRKDTLPKTLFHIPASAFMAEKNYDQMDTLFYDLVKTYKGLPFYSDLLNMWEKDSNVVLEQSLSLKGLPIDGLYYDGLISLSEEGHMTYINKTDSIDPRRFVEKLHTLFSKGEIYLQDGFQISIEDLSEIGYIPFIHILEEDLNGERVLDLNALRKTKLHEFAHAFHFKLKAYLAQQGTPLKLKGISFHAYTELFAFCLEAHMEGLKREKQIKDYVKEAIEPYGFPNRYYERFFKNLSVRDRMEKTQ